MATRTTFALVVAPIMFAATIAMADTIPFAAGHHNQVVD